MGKTSLVLDMVDVQEHDSGLRWNTFLFFPDEMSSMFSGGGGGGGGWGGLRLEWEWGG